MKSLKTVSRETDTFWQPLPAERRFFEQPKRFVAGSGGGLIDVLSAEETRLRGRQVEDKVRCKVKNHA